MKTFETEDTVYIPERDPKANTIWVITEIVGDTASIYHPMKGTEEININELEQSPF